MNQVSTYHVSLRNLLFGKTFGIYDLRNKWGYKEQLIINECFSKTIGFKNNFFFVIKIFNKIWIKERVDVVVISVGFSSAAYLDIILLKS